VKPIESFHLASRILKAKSALQLDKKTIHHAMGMGIYSSSTCCFSLDQCDKHNAFSNCDELKVYEKDMAHNKQVARTLSIFNF